MAVKIRFNLEDEVVELLSGDKVIETVETEIVTSWINAYNDKHGYKKVEDDKSGNDSTTETATGGTDGKEEPAKED